MKMFERITPEMMTLAIAALAALTLFTFLMVLISIISLSRVKKRLFAIGKTVHNVEEQHEVLRQTDEMKSYKITNLLKAVDKIESIEHHLDELDKKIAGNQRQLTGHLSRLNEHDNVLTHVDQMIGEDTNGLAQAVQKIQTFNEQVQNLEKFQRTFEQIRGRILDVLGTMQVTMPTQDDQIPERKAFRDNILIPSDNTRSDIEDLYQSNTYRYP
jgi:predicted nuclease with TOPRIM domain